LEDRSTPFFILFGTGWGLTQEVKDASDYVWPRSKGKDIIIFQFVQQWRSFSTAYSVTETAVNSVSLVNQRNWIDQRNEINQRKEKPEKRNMGKGRKRLEFILLIATLALVGIGIVMVYSTSAIMAGDRFGDPYYFLKKQAFYAAIGFVLMILMMFFPYEILKRLAYPILILSIFSWSPC
jgi:hypothetical protein